MHPLQCTHSLQCTHGLHINITNQIQIEKSSEILLDNCFVSEISENVVDSESVSVGLVYRQLGKNSRNFKCKIPDAKFPRYRRDPVRPRRM